MCSIMRLATCIDFSFHSGDSQSTADTILSPSISPAKRATRAVPLSPPPSQVAMDSPTIFSPQMIERDLQTEKLMAEMGQLRAALAAVTGSVTSSRTASASGEALLPELPSAWAEEEKTEKLDASADLDSDASWLLRRRSPSIQVSLSADTTKSREKTQPVVLLLTISMRTCRGRHRPKISGRLKQIFWSWRNSQSRNTWTS
jgi:hypothetical protein